MKREGRNAFGSIARCRTTSSKLFCTRTSHQLPLSSAQTKRTHLENPFLDQVLDRLGRLLGDDGHDLSAPLVLEVLLEERVDRPVARLGLSLGRPILDADVLGFEGGDLGREGEKTAFVAR